MTSIIQTLKSPAGCYTPGTENTILSEEIRPKHKNSLYILNQKCWWNSDTVTQGLEPKLTHIKGFMIVGDIAEPEINPDQGLYDTGWHKRLPSLTGCMKTRLNEGVLCKLGLCWVTHTLYHCIRLKLCLECFPCPYKAVAVFGHSMHSGQAGLPFH